MSTKSEKSNISDVPNVDVLLYKLSNVLFDLDDVSQTILAICGTEGPQTEYKLQKKISKTSRFSIRRRINDQNGLLELNFLYESKGKKHKSGNIERPFALTFKGFIASLSKTNFEKNFLMKLYKQDLIKRSDSQFAEFALQYMKYNLALILYWHMLNDLKLTNQKNPVDYFTHFNNLQLYDKFPFNLEYIKNQKFFNEFSTLRGNFLAIQITIARLLQKREKKYWFEPYDRSILSNKLQLYKSKTLLYDMIKNWIGSLVFSQYVETHVIPQKIGAGIGNIIRVDTANKASAELLHRFFQIKTLKHPIPII